MSVSAVVVSFRTGPVLLDCLRAALDQVDEVVLVDNGNTAEARAELASFALSEPRLRLLQGHGNIGFARACNYGAALSGGDFLLFLNPDAVMRPGCVEAMLHGYRSGTGAAPALVGGRIMNPDGTEARGSRRAELRFRSFLPGADFNWNTRPLPDGPVLMDNVSGALMLMWRNGFNHVGGFDPGYFLHVEDIALCLAVWEDGGDVIIAPDAVADHVGGSSDAPAFWVEMHKWRSFLRYFWAGRSVGSKLGAILLAGPLALSLLARHLLKR